MVEIGLSRQSYLSLRNSELRSVSISCHELRDYLSLKRKERKFIRISLPLHLFRVEKKCTLTVLIGIIGNAFV